MGDRARTPPQHGELHEQTPARRPGHRRAQDQVIGGEADEARALERSGQQAPHESPARGRRAPERFG